MNQFIFESYHHILLSLASGKITSFFPWRMTTTGIFERCLPVHMLYPCVKMNSFVYTPIGGISWAAIMLFSSDRIIWISKRTFYIYIYSSYLVNQFLKSG